jgi:hypothetical protein
MTNPPVSLGGKGCHEQALFLVRGRWLTAGPWLVNRSLGSLLMDHGQ